jgi:hypothetical protein
MNEVVTAVEAKEALSELFRGNITKPSGVFLRSTSWLPRP